MQTHNNVRLDYLDAARAIALLLGIVFHASISFMPIFIGWAVMDISTNEAVPIFMLVSHSFRMALFFLIAGFFSHMTFHQQGAHGFLKSRLVRIGIPLVIGWFLLRPLLVLCWTMGTQSMRGEVEFKSAFSAAITSLSDLPSGLLIGTHLWFLYYLLLICAGVLLIRLLLGLLPSLKTRMTQLADKAITWFCHSQFSIVVLCLPTAACLWFMQHWGIDTPDKSLVPLIPVALLYAGFFLFGWLLQRQSSLMAGFSELTWLKFILCVISILVTLKLSAFEMQLSHPNFMLFKAGYMLSYALMMWLLVSISIGLCKRVFTAPNKYIRYLADSSYWLYLIHLPLVIGLQIAFAELAMYWLIKLVCIVAITILISILVYDGFVRSTFIGATLNGKRQSRLIFNLDKQH
ncbi:acyltransferase family protein [uncultured Paraglaciecola sp.]|uniref:acyltransferase family protein n=1 Tax=uncultured Paraglaciecola sp. TaxID=1765024 RepID=UPI0030D9426C|tara:strand:- start:57980 stop:59191 length:1212 start_codon:yes stop_codon:yes gene_type:complete